MDTAQTNTIATCGNPMYNVLPVNTANSASIVIPQPQFDNKTTLTNDATQTYVPSEESVNVCGIPSYGSQPANIGCDCKDVTYPEHHVVNTDRVYDKQLNAWQSEINEKLNKKGQDGDNAISISVISNKGLIMVGGEDNTTLTAQVFDGIQDITKKIPNGYISWSRISSVEGIKTQSDQIFDLNNRGVGASIIVPTSSIIKKVQYYCTFDLDSYYKNI